MHSPVNIQHTNVLSQPTSTSQRRTRIEHVVVGQVGELKSRECWTTIITITRVTNEIPKCFGNAKNLIKIFWRVMILPPTQNRLSFY